MLADTYRREKVQLDRLFDVDYPAYFVHPAAEYQALVDNAGVIDLTHWRVFRLSGKDRVSFLQAMVTNDVDSIEPGMGVHSLITTIKGKIVAELLLFAKDDVVLVLVPQGDADEAYDIFKKHIIMEDVAIDDISSQYGVIAIEGPRSEDIMWRLFPTGPFPKEPLQTFDREFDDAKIFLFRHSATGETGYQLMIPVEHIEYIRDYIVQAARGSDGLPIGSIAWNMRRIEMGLPWYGIDFDEENFPDESRLGSTISYTKGCFRGQETLARLHYRGHVNRVLAGLTTTDDPTQAIDKAVAEFASVINNYDEEGLKQEARASAELLTACTATEGDLIDVQTSKPIGRVTSVAFSPRLGKSLLLGYIRREIVEEGHAVRLESLGELSTIDLPIVIE